MKRSGSQRRSSQISSMRIRWRLRPSIPTYTGSMSG